MPKRGIGILPYGPTGIGKTHWSIWWPKPLTIISIHETGFDDLAYIQEPPAPDCVGLNITDYAQLINFLAGVTAPTRTLVIDSLSGFQQIFFEFLIKSNMSPQKDYEKSKDEFWSYYRGPRMQAVNEIPMFTALLTQILNKGIHVILIGHKRSDTEQNVAGADYHRAEIDMDEGIRNAVLKWAPNVIYMSMQPNIVQATHTAGYGKNVTVTEGKTDALGTKLIYTSTNPQNSAKNKLHLPSLIPIGKSAKETFDSFWHHVPAVYKGEQ